MAQPDEVKEARNQRKQSNSNSGQVLLSLMACAASGFALWSAFSANKAVESSAQVVQMLQERVESTKTSQLRIQSIQDGLARPVRREFLIEVPPGAKECRIVVEGSAIEAGGRQEVRCR